MANALINVMANSATVIINGRAITDFNAGDMITLAPANAETARIHGSNGITGITQRADEDVYDITINVVKYSDSDVYLNRLLNECAIIEGSIKETYSKNRFFGQSSWSITHGSFTTKPTDTKNNQDGNMGVSYVIQARARRSL